MESVPATLYNGINGYWKRNGYERLNGTAGRRRKIRVVKLTSADGTNQRRRFWRIKLTPSLKLKIKFSPKKLLRRLRDAYVNMMMKIGNTPALGGFPGGGVSGFGRGPMKEYDERIITEIYKSVLMAQSKMVPREATRTGSGSSANGIWKAIMLGAGKTCSDKVGLNQILVKILCMVPKGSIIWEWNCTKTN